jgi:hypothetical protein|tara:strand:- start:49 stop:264 length:216 start_codon:yes stop_codon:yes gene_type:complete
MQYKGFTYEPWLDEEEDNRKIFHDVYYEGKEVKMPHWFSNISPYRDPTPAEFINAVNEIYFQHWVKKKVDK